MNRVADKIVYYAKLFEGIKEKGNNQGWKDVFFPTLGKTFEELMVEVGWESSHAWCAYFTELVWKLAYKHYDHPLYYKLENLFSASVMNTYYNFKRSDFVCSNTPQVGSLVIWNLYKNGKSTTRGHTGIVISVKGARIKSIEGNTGGVDRRNGDQVAQKSWLVDFMKKDNGLNLIGFVHPKPIDNFFI